MRWRLFRRNHGTTGTTASPVSAADVAGPTAVVLASAAVRDVVDAVTPGMTVQGVGSLVALWTGIASGELDPVPALVVLSRQPGDSVDALAEAVAFFAPRTSVVLLYPAGDLEHLGERYQRVVAAHPDVCDEDAPVEVVSDFPTGDGVAAAVRAAQPAGVTVTDCPPLLVGPVDPHAATPAPVVVRPRPAEPEQRGTVIAVASAKGGAGKSTTAVALAGTLAATGKRVCLVDLDLRDGQLATLLDSPLPTIASLARDSAGITDDTVLAHLTYNDKLGVAALLAPTRGDDPDVRDPVLHRHILTVLRRHFDVIVLDCPVTYRDPLLAGMAFVEAERVVAVSTLAVTSLAGLRRMLLALTNPPTDGGLAVPRRKFGVVVNGALNGVAVDRAEVDAHTTGLPVVAIVPHAPRDALIATNTRRLDLLVTHPDLAPAYRDLAQWCVSPVQAAPTAAHPRRALRRVRVA